MNEKNFLSSILNSIQKAEAKDSSSPIASLNISVWNVNSIKKAIKKPDFYNFIKKNTPNILCLTETKTIITEHDRYREHFSYPYQYWSSASTHKSGVCILSDIKALSCMHGLNFSSLGRVLTAEYFSFFLCVVYCPLPKSNENVIERVKWDEELRKYLAELKSKKPVIWVGDFNIVPSDIDADSSNLIVGTDSRLRHSFKNNLKIGFVDSFRFLHCNERCFTWRSSRSPGFQKKKSLKTRIDVILLDTSWTSFLQSASIHENFKLVSDHCPISVFLSFPSSINF